MMGSHALVAGENHPFHSRFNPGDGNSIGYEEMKCIEAYQFLQSIVDGKQGNPGFCDVLEVANAEAAIKRSCGREWRLGKCVQYPLIAQESILCYKENCNLVVIFDKEKYGKLNVSFFLHYLYLGICQNVRSRIVCTSECEIRTIYIKNLCQGSQRCANILCYSVHVHCYFQPPVLLRTNKSSSLPRQVHAVCHQSASGVPNR